MWRGGHSCAFLWEPQFWDKEFAFPNSTPTFFPLELRNSWRWERTQSMPRVWRGLSQRKKKKKAWAPRGVLGNGNPSNKFFYKEHFDSAHEWFNWNLLLPSFFLPHLELENALKRSSSFGNNRKRSIYIYINIYKNGNYELQGGQIYFYSVIVSVCHVGSWI